MGSESGEVPYPSVSADDLAEMIRVGPAEEGRDYARDLASAPECKFAIAGDRDDDAKGWIVPRTSSAQLFEAKVLELAALLRTQGYLPVLYRTARSPENVVGCLTIVNRSNVV